MNNQKYRPLIKLQHSIEHIFLPLDYSYSLSEISKIKKYLPKIYSFFGVDAQQYSQSEQSLFQREKLKLKAVSGISIVDEKQMKFYKDTQLQTKQWKQIYVCLDIPFNSRQSQEAAKQQLQSKLQVFLKEAITFKNLSTKQIYKTNDKQTVKLDQLDIFFEPLQMKAEAFDNSYRQIRCHLPLFVALPRSESYSVATLFQYIRDDVINSLKLMIKNQLSIRVLFKSKNLVLQSFIKAQNEREIEEKKLVSIVEKKRQVVSKEQQNIQSENQVKNNQDGQETSNKGLLAILIALIVIYIYLKLNPLKKQLDSLESSL